MQFQFGVVLGFLLTSAGIVGIALFLGRFLRPNIPDPQKASIYESGEKPIGSAWFNFNPRFYVLALVFLIFDVEIALTYPAALVLREWVESGKGLVAIVEITLFLVVLAAALAWVWGKGALSWVREIGEPEEESFTRPTVAEAVREVEETARTTESTPLHVGPAEGVR